MALKKKIKFSQACVESAIYIVGYISIIKQRVETLEIVIVSLLGHSFDRLEIYR